MKLSILIPTYNRRNFLERNYEALCKSIITHALTDQVKIIISNNASTDDTASYIEKIKKNTDVSCEIHNQKKNIGSVNNVLFLLNISTTEYILFLGDDDYIAPGYLTQVIKEIEDTKTAVIIPSNKGITPLGKDTGFSRDIHMASSRIKAGFSACLKHSWRGHQLSGLVFRRAGLAEACKKLDVTNMYLFIFLVGYSALRGNVIHLTEHPALITSAAQSDKEWSYGDDALISDIFDNYKKLEGINPLQRSLLELKILDEQYWRYMMYIKLGFRRFARVLLNIIMGKNTSFLTRVAFPLLLPVFLVKRVIILISSGDLIKILNRPVDI